MEEVRKNTAPLDKIPLNLAVTREFPIIQIVMV